MVYDGIIEGKYVNLRSVSVEDADFTLKIRQDPEVTKYIPRLDITIEQQKNWIKSQREKSDDFFFIVYNKCDCPIGTISIYDIKECIGESGRLVLKGNVLENIETQLLLYNFVFDVLNLDSVSGYIYKENKRALRFAKQFGGLITNDVLKDEVLFSVVSTTKENFHIAAKKLQVILYK